MKQVKFIAFADSHWDQLGAKCVTLEDTDRVERAIFQRAIDGQFDFVLFAGDRFLKHEPDDETKFRSDKVVFDLVHPGTIPYFHLVGNHDWTDKSRRWHTANSLKRMNNVIVMDETKTYQDPSLLNVRIHALPADFQMELEKYSFNNEDLNLFCFHDMVRGSFSTEDQTMAFDSGMEVSSFDVKQFDMVLAGDIHVRQQFKLLNTGGGYLGSVTQRTRADSNRERGWTEITAVKARWGWDFSVVFVPTRNLFTRFQFGVNEFSVAKDLPMDPKLIVDQLVEIRLVGDKKDVDRIAEDPYWKALAKKNLARLVDILPIYEAQQADTVVDMTASTSIIDDLNLYLDSDFASLGNIKREDILAAMISIAKE